MTDPLMVDVKAASALVSITPERIRQACASGALPAVNASTNPERSVWRIDREALHAWALAGYPTAVAS